MSVGGLIAAVVTVAVATVAVRIVGWVRWRRVPTRPGYVVVPPSHPAARTNRRWG